MALPNSMASLIFAFTFLTVLRLGRLANHKTMLPGKMFSYFPLVGLVIGAIISLVAPIRFLPPDLTAFVVLVVWIGLTGGLHLDGLADSCDGLFSTVSPERRLEIMKDPRAGSWAVIGVVLTLLGKWVTLRSLLPLMSPLMLLAPPIIGRWGMVFAVAAFPSASSAGLAAAFRVGFSRRQFISATLITLGIVIALSVLVSWRYMLLLVVTLLTVFTVGHWAARRLGGLTGDVYGALCEVVELLCLICLNIM
jgi:adenosylcobinamide-GDP ribazoletransferase